MNPITGSGQDTVLAVRVVPNASRSEVAQVGPDAIRIRLQAPPVEGKANKALIAFLADTLGLRPRQISIAAGEHARTKRVVIAGMPPSAVAERLSRGAT